MISAFNLQITNYKNLCTNKKSFKLAKLKNK